MNTLNYLLVAIVLIMVGAFVSPAELSDVERSLNGPISTVDMDLT